MSKCYEDLKFTDDFMFWNILVSRQDLCKELLEMLLGVSIKKICPPEGQKMVENAYDSRGIRLDVYVNDDAGTVYDLEMQTTLKTDLPKRIRYYQGMIDLKLIQRSEPYSKLKKSYIIFLCTKDPFGYHIPVYSFENFCIQEKSQKLGDEAVKIIINPDSKRDNLSDEMNGFLDLLQGKEDVSGLAGRLSEAVEAAKNHSKWRMEYMTMQLKLKEEREEGRAEGKAEGITEIIRQMLNKGRTPEEISSFCGLSLEEIAKASESVTA